MNIDQMAAKEALLCPPIAALVLAAATAIETMICMIAKIYAT